MLDNSNQDNSMQTLIDIEEQQLNKLLFYTHAKNGTEAITQIIQD